MKKIRTSLISILAVLFVTTIYAQPPGSGWNLNFDENFNGNSLNTTIWRIRKDSQFNAGNITVRNGNLEISNKYGNTGTPNGAWIETFKQFRYGYFECRLRHQWRDRNVWPTWWVWGGKPQGQPEASEFDICEWNHFNYDAGTGPNQSHHYRGKPQGDSSYQVKSPVDMTKWHKWGMLWTPNEVTFYIDGKRQFSSPKPRTANDFLNLILSSSPDKFALPARGRNLPTIYFDYVKVWQGGNAGNTNPRVPYGSIIAIKAKANNKNVTAENGGNAPLIANRPNDGGTWERFQVINPGQGFVALKSLANNKMVTAEDKGKKPLLARGNPNNLGRWEKFIWQWNADNTFSLLSHANSKYVSAENAGNSALIANRITIGGSWEKFTYTNSSAKNLTDISEKVYISQNPLRKGELVTINGLNSDETTFIKINDISGRIVEDTYSINANSITLLENSLSTGVYIVTITKGSEVISKKLVVE